MRSAPLTVIKGGIDRERPKGGARADTMYDLLNARVTREFNVVPREGTVRIANLPPGTVGLTAFNGKFNVFASTSVDLTAFPEFRLNILTHPTDPAATVTKIHFAEPFMGALYIVAEFSDGSIHHFWMQEGMPWEANTEYAVNTFVRATPDTGVVFRATRLGAGYPAWTPGAARALADRIEPTVYNDFFYEVVEVSGDNPRSGSIEPPWPLITGTRIVESTDGLLPQAPPDATPPQPPKPTEPQEDIPFPFGSHFPTFLPLSRGKYRR
jgi:hypothetical protein